MSNGGGAELAFKIVRYKSEEEMRDSTPPNNTIGVITSEKISSWIFSAEKPNSPDKGMLWIQTGNNSLVKFNALKKNSLMVYPLRAEQYKNGVWETVIIKTYINNNGWVDWIIDIILLENGIFNNDYWEDEIIQNLTKYQKDNYFYFDTKGNFYKTFYTKPVSFNGLTSIELKCQKAYNSDSGSNDMIRLSIYENLEILTADNFECKNSIKYGTFSEEEIGKIKLDISDLSKEYYIKIGIKCNSTNSEKDGADFKIFSLKALIEPTSD